ncbi:DegT/DnrJ/EryC1/StrS family aminotransferase [Acidobacteria bacterium AH-259-L09]|nr:DegT/DnrJ/EryC1/StrS family aminotransferase [Acidobacteria bacterium AH-259-L09]
MNIPAARIYFPEEDRKLIQERIAEVLDSGVLTLGKFSRLFEEEFAAYVGTRYAVSVNSGTSALEIPLRVWGVEGHSVVVPTNTFMATALAVWHAGGEVIFADVDRDLCLDPSSLESSIREDTKVVIVVHIGGVVAPQIRRIQEICRLHNLLLLEDAAHAHGSAADNWRAGTLGHAAAFSFYPTKLMTSAEGGMIVTDDGNLHQRAKVFRDQGKAGFLGNVHTELGYNWRMSEVHAAIGLTHLYRLDEFISARRRIARVYNEGLSNLSYVTAMAVPDNIVSNFYKYIAFLDKEIDRSELKKRLRDEFSVNLSGEVYELPLHSQPVVEGKRRNKGEQFPIAEELCSRHICLPVYPEMKQDEAEYVVDALRRVLE